ncbi:MAG: hypothetical protein NTX15_02125 [Candidatus Kapabacteria bacterium]|nr:hypothetical protein [Candidatus Kapabacteria bacterium]
MKTILTVWVIIGVITTGVCASAQNRDQGTGVGIQFGYPGNVGLSLRFDQIALGAAWRLGDNGYLHLTADYWLLKKKLVKNVDWYLGPGVNIGIGDPFILGVRLPIGLQWMPAKQLEIFGELAPCFYLLKETKFDVNAAIGIRYIL